MPDPKNNYTDAADAFEGWREDMLGSILDKVTAEAGKPRGTETVAASACLVKRKDPLTTAVNGSHLVEPKGIEPSTSWLQTRGSSVASGSGKGLAPTPSAACTCACTSEGENANADAADIGKREQGEGTAAADQGDPLAKLAAALLTLSPVDQERLAALLTAQRGDV